MAPLEFYFDFASPYAYLAAERLEEIAARRGRETVWRPIMLGAVFKETGMGPLFHQPMRGPYGERDFLRSARLYGLPARIPEKFPYTALAVSRAFYWIDASDPKAAKRYGVAVFRRYYGDGIAPESEDEAVSLAEAVGIDGSAARAGIREPEIKARLKDETEQAIGRGVFGAPFIFVDGEPFWGADRLDQIDAWLERGGW